MNNLHHCQGTYLISQAGAKSLIERQKDSLVSGGSIINISSVISVSGVEGHAHYAASKAGVLGLTKTVAKELAPYNIRCNAVLPGFIVTPMTSAITTEKFRNDILEKTSLGRHGQPEGEK